MYLEFILIGLLIALIVVVFFKQPSKLYGIIVKSVIANIRENEPYIVQGLYNSLPKSIKDQIDSQQVATIVVYILNIIIGILEETIVKEKTE